jgi:NAD(P)-dependent dehydrogenase (short-subunit alcohol dehydrogenase family)
LHALENEDLAVKFLIYGASQGRGDGIGRQAALALVEKGHEVRGLCRDGAKAAAEKAFPLEALDILTTAGQDRIKELIRELEPDVVWSACGVGFPSPLWNLPDAEIEEMIEANVKVNVLFCKACAPSCLDGGAHLILTGSVAGVLETTGTALYSGVKGFLVPFVRGQRAEYRRQGHHPKLSLLNLHAVRNTGLGIVVDALEFVGRQSHSVEILVG